MSRILIIGYGNSLRGDDGFGPALAQRLQDEFQDHADIEIIAGHQLTLEFAEPISRAQRVVFIDAAIGETPGEIAFQKIEPAPDALTQRLSPRFTHHLSPPTLLAYTQLLYKAHPSEAFLLSVTGKNFGYSEALSEPVENAMRRAQTILREMQICQPAAGSIRHPG
jgi:hydrogenase maturation protease